jgi:hypothetical protein
VIEVSVSLQLGGHIRGKRKREEMQTVIQNMRKAAAAEKKKEHAKE